MNNPYSQDPQGGYPSEPQYATYGEARPKNILGIVGFIFAVTCLLAPLGLLLSFIALFKRPRGFAIAGFLVGALFSIPHGSIAFSAIRFAMLSPAELAVEVTNAEVAAILTESSYHLTVHGSLPDSADQLDLAGSTATDFWGNPYRLEITEGRIGTLKVISAGPDGIYGTSDDLDLTAMADSRQGKADFVRLLESEINPDTFDRRAMRKELGNATSDMFSSLIRTIQAGTREGFQTETPSPESPSDGSADPDDQTPADPDPETPGTP